MRLLFVGDVMLGRLVNEVLRKKTPEYPWGDTLSIFNNADWRMINLECVISDRGRPWRATPKVFHFRTDPKNIEVLKTANINAVALSNNHVLDFEYDALIEMLRLLDDAGMGHAGAGMNIEEAMRSCIQEVKGKKIGLIAFTDNEPDWEAKENRPGIFYVPVDLKDSRAKKLLEIVKETKKKVDLLFVSPHWGPNWGYEPPPEHISFAHALIESGADIIHGHSSHVFRGVEIYKRKVIMYSAGDFVDDYAVDEIERNDQSFIFIIETNGSKFRRLILYPTVIRDFQARLAEGREQRESALKMQELCKGFGTRIFWNMREGWLEIPYSSPFSG